MGAQREINLRFRSIQFHFRSNEGDLRGAQSRSLYPHRQCGRIRLSSTTIVYTHNFFREYTVPKLKDTCRPGISPLNVEIRTSISGQPPVVIYITLWL